MGVAIGCGDDGGGDEPSNSPDDRKDAGPSEMDAAPPGKVDPGTIKGLVDAHVQPEPDAAKPEPDAMVDGGGDAQVDACVPDDEICNDRDDDCDGETDEGFDVGEACDGEDADECEDGEIVCDDRGRATCDDRRNDSPELCNGEDDDCDGEMDEGFDVGDDCSAGVGACASDGHLKCNAEGTRAICDAEPGAPEDEICGDSIDQDCSGADAPCPANDLPANAIDITPGGNFTADMHFAHDDEAGSGSNGCGTTVGRDLYYTFTLASAEVVYFDTFGSDFDSVLRIYQGACTSRTGDPLCNDDGPCDPEAMIYQSMFFQQLNAGTYCLVLDEFNGEHPELGQAKLKYVRGGRPGTELNWAASSGTVTGDTCTSMDYASTEPCQPNAMGEDIGYFFTLCPGEQAVLTANTCSNTAFDTILNLYNVPNACNDDAVSGTCGPSGFGSSITKVFSGAGLYWMVIDGFHPSSGSAADCGTFQIDYTLGLTD